MNAQFDCPGIEDWQALFSEAAHSEQWQRYERHLESCAICQKRLDSSEPGHDPLVALGRQLGDPTRTSIDPTLAAVVERLRANADAERPGPEIPELYFLGTPPREGVLGMLGEYE